jgi:hypothetical protein
MKFSDIPLSIQHAMRAGADRDASDRAMDDARDTRRGWPAKNQYTKKMVGAYVRRARQMREDYRYWLKSAMREHASEILTAEIMARGTLAQQLRRDTSNDSQLRADFRGALASLSSLSIMQKQAE